MSLADELLADLEGDDDGEYYKEAGLPVEDEEDPQKQMDIPMEEGNNFGYIRFAFLTATGRVYYCILIARY